MNRFDAFLSDQAEIGRLDFRGLSSSDAEMHRQYQRRNSFGLDPARKIHRIFQKAFYEKDVADGYLTLPRASASVWGDLLENPLENVTEIDPVTGDTVNLGSLVNGFYGLCWTARDSATDRDWDYFSHEVPAIRITTSVGRLLGRMMRLEDPWYMNRSWIIQVDYKDSPFIKMMQNPGEVHRRIESTGALLALSTAIVDSNYDDEDEVRVLFDNSITSACPGVVSISGDPDLVRVPFDWSGIVEKEVLP